MKDDVILNKISSIERCLNRIKEEYQADGNKFRSNYTVQDSILLNLQRACESCIDLSNYIIKKNKLGLPQNSRESFEILSKANIIDSSLAEKMKHMVGFRNIAIHEYHTLNLNIVDSIIQNNLVDFQLFTAKILQFKPEA
jgi:uncharacterized protein YutE (UPF0331/DUF86 family)